MFPTPLEQLEMNPEQLTVGDVAYLPSGERVEIVKLGFKYCVLQDGRAVVLKNLTRKPLQPSLFGEDANG